METAKVVQYTIAQTKDDFIQAAQLFRAYAASLAVDLSFQDFDNELKTIDCQYNKPAGALLIASIGKMAVACTGIRKLSADAAELKRMYVKETYRGRGIGAELLKRSIIIARELGYQSIRLDTLADMTKAQQLYRTFDFYIIAPYRFNPHEGTVYMELQL